MAKKVSLMLIDDSVIILLDLQRAIKKMCSETGFQLENLITAKNYDEAIQKYKIYRPNTIIFDVNLGSQSKNGFEIADEILSIKSEKDKLNVIFLTAYTDKDTVIEATRLNSMGFLNKPFKDKNLIKILQKAETKLNLTTL